MMVLAWGMIVLAVPAAGVAGTQPTASVSAPSVTDTAARLDRLTIEITGTVTQRRRAERRNYRRIEGGKAACMRAAGHPYRKMPFTSFYADFTDADLGYGSGYGSTVDDITDRGRRQILNELAFARLERAGAIEPSVPAADVAAYNACSSRYDYRLYHDFDMPAGAERLSGFPDLLGPVLADPTVRAAMRPYRGCMKSRYGYDVDERTDFLFTPRLQRADAPVDGARPGKAWKRGIKQIRAAYKADTDCRRPAYLAAMKLLAPRIGPWEISHRAEIDAVRAAWDK
ncbi:hypothetical protein [Actinoplanes sp. NPDC051494]|uniref:hypothetical protein n=1 Tax=Actinoplanes sp. NPDC051494 TaxID=3363907 RepID=UPI0037AE1D4C